EHLEESGVAGVGGPIRTIASTRVGQAIAGAMSSKFGVGPSSFRTIKDRTVAIDTVAFPAYTRSAVELAGPFDEELVRNQDDEYNYRLRKMGARLLLAADVRSDYYSRRTLRSLWRPFFEHGFYKVRVMQNPPPQMPPRQFVPPAFAAALLVSAIAASATWLGVAALLTILGTYAIALLAAAASVARRHSWNQFPGLLAA